jgi:hypothetical protein
MPPNTTIIVAWGALFTQYRIKNNRDVTYRKNHVTNTEKQVTYKKLYDTKPVFI